MDRIKVANQLAEKHLAQHVLAGKQSLHQASNNRGVNQTREVYRPTGIGKNAIDTEMVKQSRPFTQGGRKYGWAGQGTVEAWRSQTGLELDNLRRPAFFPAKPDPSA